MIFLLAGTKDGRKLGEEIAKKNYPLIISVTSEYGKSLIEENKNIVINNKQLDLDELIKYLKENGVDFLIDASHPYAVNVSTNAIAAAQRLNIKYTRYERAKTVVDYDNIYFAKDNTEAAKLAAKLGENIFFTTGSRSAKYFFEEPLLKNHKLVFRVFPDAKVLSELNVIGIVPENIVALKGPFSVNLNYALFEAYGADVIVTKDSGNIGGADTKIQAAKAMNLPVVIIERPKINYPDIAYDFNEILKKIERKI